jgi:hypothetical protein
MTEPAHSCPYCQPWMTMLADLNWRLHTFDSPGRTEALDNFWTLINTSDFATLRWPVL